jgi:hypothetical protein
MRKPGAGACLALLLLTAGCAAKGGSTGPGSPVRTKGGAKHSGGPAASYDDAGVLGSMAKTYLKGSPAKRLVVEVDYVTGREPAQSALDHLADVLNKVSDKPGGISVTKGNAFASSKSTYSVSDIRAIERANRSEHSSGGTATMWMVYLNGSYSNGGALGISYDATSAAIFRDQIDNATTAIIDEAAIERAVITHEAGHLLALINIGYKSRRDHEDPQHPHHSKNDRSVMYWAVEDVRLRNLLTGGPPSEFDDDDLADLAVLKAS